VKYIRRFIGFIATRILWFTIIVSVLACAFYMCMNTANVYIVLTDGMEKRVDVILTREDAEELNNYFHADFLSQDPALRGAFDGTSVYDAYKITDYEYSLTIERLWAWPWDEYATATVVEQVHSISGKVYSSRVGDVSEEIPSWRGGRYELTLSRVEGRWKVRGIRQTAIFAEAEATQ